MSEEAECLNCGNVAGQCNFCSLYCMEVFDAKQNINFYKKIGGITGKALVAFYTLKLFFIEMKNNRSN
jgi:hypothetical protein